MSDSSVDAFVESLPDESHSVSIKVDDLDVLRRLAMPRSREPRTLRMRVAVRSWTPPVQGWSGRLGPVPSLVSVATTYPRKRAGFATTQIEVGEPVAVSELAAAAYPLFAVTRPMHGSTRPRLVVAADVPAGTLALLPTPIADRFRPKPSEALNGVGLADAELALVSGEEQGHEHLTSLEEAQWARQVLVVDEGGRVVGDDRRRLPLLDLTVHNPRGRLVNFSKPRRRVTDCRVVDGSLIVAVAGSGGGAEHVIDLDRPVGARVVRDLALVEHMSLADVAGGGPGGHDDGLAGRLAELAATGLVLHSLPAAVDLHEAGLSPRLEALLHQPYIPTLGLDRDLRSVAQRRAAMLDHGGFVEFARTAQERTGHRLMPTVSLVMSAMRAHRVPRTVEMLRRQDYPHLEVVVAMHGVEAPALELAEGGHPVTVFEAPKELSFGAVLASAARRAGGDLVVKVDDDDLYGPGFVTDLVLAYLYSSANLVGKTTEYAYFEGIDQTVHRSFATERYHTQAAGGAMMLSRGDLEAIGGWRPTPNSTDRSILIGLARAGGTVYRTNSIDYIYVRHSDGHTWARSEEQLIRGSFEQWLGPQMRVLTGEGLIVV